MDIVTATPRVLLSAVMAAALVIMFAAAAYLLSIPRLGLELKPAASTNGSVEGLVVTSASSWSPNKGRIAVGTVLTSVLATDGTIVEPVKLIPE